MDDFLEIFTEDGMMLRKVESYFTSCDQVDSRVIDIIEYCMDSSMPIYWDSDAVALLYADKFESDGYSAFTLFCRHKG